MPHLLTDNLNNHESRVCKGGATRLFHFHQINMHDHSIKAMVQALKPTLKDPKRAEQILERFWRDKIALVWDIEHVHTAANEKWR